MKNLTMIKSKFALNDSLSLTVRKNTFYSIILKFSSVFLSFWSIRVAFEFAGSQQLYGVWLTILSVLSWLNLLNGGMSNGLRNKLSAAIANDNQSNAKSYVSTSYVFISIISACCCLFFILISIFFDWRSAFNAFFVSKSEFLLLMIIVVISYFLQIVLSTISALCFAVNKAVLPSMFNFLSNLLFVISLYILKFFHGSGLLILGFVYSITILIVLLVANILLFSNEFRDMRPNITYFNYKYVRELMGNGIKFFFLEISAVVIFTTDSMVISHVVGSDDVATYQLILKLFSVFTIISNAIMIPLWSAYTHAFSKGDVNWIKKTMKKNLLLMIPFVAGVIIFTFLVNPILGFWIDKEFIISKLLVWSIGIYTIITVWSNIFAYLLNGINKINGQLLIVGLGALVNIPLSIYLSKNLGYGTTGVVLGTIICLTPFALVGPIISYFYIKKVAS